jgi:hypothetical protein
MNKPFLFFYRYMYDGSKSFGRMCERGSVSFALTFQRARDQTSDRLGRPRQPPAGPSWAAPAASAQALLG